MTGESQLTTAVFRPLAVLMLAVVITGTGCDNNSDSAAAYPAVGRSDCLRDIMLVDQYGKPFSLASLKGTPVLFDFFYTTCPGPCLVLTARMRSIAEKVGDALGSKVSFVSITVDPERDTPPQLLTYSKEQRADRKGWVFLTGNPTQVNRVMERFKLVRRRDADGSVAHVLEFFLVGADGRLRYQYLASEVHPERIAADMAQATGEGRIAAKISSHPSD